MKKITIEGMKCMSCFRNIEDALTEFDPEVMVEPRMEEKSILVSSTKLVDDLTDIIENAGYKVKAVTNGTY